MLQALPKIKIDFNSEGHVYTLDGFTLPSVTQIMRPMSSLIYDSVSESTLMIAADRGSRAHEQISNHVLYGIDETDEDTEPFINAYLKFEADRKPIWVGSEYRCYHRVMRYAGTLDLIGYVNPDDGNGFDIVDLKCTSAFHRALLSTQLGAYKAALSSHAIKIRKLYGLQLLANGSYCFEEVEDGYKNFLFCVGIVNAIKDELAAK